MTKPTRILVVDDHAIVRHGLALLLSKHRGFAIAAEAGGVEEARQALKKNVPDLAIIDLSLKDGNGLDLVRDIRQRHPELPCIVLSMHDEMEYAERAIRIGARGYVMKEDADEVIVDAIRTVLRGEVYASPDVTAKMLRTVAEGASQPDTETGIATLTDREREIFRSLGQGLTTKKIAEHYGLSARTVEVHRSSIKRKLGCEDTAQLLREAVRWAETNS